LPLLKFKPS